MSNEKPIFNMGYFTLGDTDVRIDTSAHGQSWDNEVINKQQFEEGLLHVHISIGNWWDFPKV